jgi:hypothetical protein
MLHRRHAISILLAGLSVTTLMPSTGRADQRFRRFLPFLVELKGWTGQEPTGFAMENAGMSMVTATREYQRNDARLNAGLVSCPLAAAFTSPNAGMNIETLAHEHKDDRRLSRDEKLYRCRQLRLDPCLSRQGGDVHVFLQGHL